MQTESLVTNRRKTLERFRKHVVVLQDGCWVFLGPTNQSGHGVFGYTINGSYHKVAHRYAYLLTGLPLAPTNQIHHLCGRSGCVNPSHLTQLSPEHHIQVTPGSPVLKRRRATHCPHGHEYTKSNTRLQQRGNYTIRRCRRCDDFYKGRRKER